MGAHRLDVVCDQGGAARGIRTTGGGRNMARFEVGGERHFRVDGDALAAGETDDHVGTAGSRIGDDARLHVEIDALEEPCSLHHAAQLCLAPHAADAVGSERRCQRLCGAAQALLGFCCGSQLLAQCAELQSALLFEFSDLALHRFELVAHRCEGHEHLAVGAQTFRFGCLGLPRSLLQVEEVLFDAADLVGIVLALAVELFASAFERCGGSCEARLRASSGNEPSDDRAGHGSYGEADEEPCDQGRCCVHALSMRRGCDIARKANACPLPWDP